MLGSVVDSIETSTGQNPPYSLRKVVSLAETNSLATALDNLSNYRGYQVYFNNVKCIKENETSKDEIYAFFVTCGWGPENDYKPWVRVRSSKKFGGVVEGKFYGTDSMADNTWLWGDRDDGNDTYRAMQKDRTLFLVSAMESDSGNRSKIESALKKMMKNRFYGLLAGAVSRSKLVSKMMAQMDYAIEKTRCADATLVDPGTFDEIDSYANLPEQLVCDAVDYLVGNELRDLVKSIIHESLQDVLAPLDNIPVPDNVSDADDVINEIIEHLFSRLKTSIAQEICSVVTILDVDDVKSLLGVALNPIKDEVRTTIRDRIQHFEGENWSSARESIESALAATIVNEIISIATKTVINAIPGVQVAGLVQEIVDFVTDVLEILENIGDCDDHVGYPKELKVYEIDLTPLVDYDSRVTMSKEFSGNGKYEYNFTVRGKDLPIKDVRPVPSLSP